MSKRHWNVRIGTVFTRVEETELVCELVENHDIRYVCRIEKRFVKTNF